MADMTGSGDGGAEMLDVRRAAALVGRHPETVRRWIWSGRLRATRSGNRLLVARDDLEATATGTRGGVATDLGAWADLARRAREVAAGAGPRGTAADLVIEDRRRRPAPDAVRAGR